MVVGYSVTMTEALFRAAFGARGASTWVLSRGCAVFPLIPGYAYGHVVLPGAIHGDRAVLLAAACKGRLGVMLQGG